ncbi:PDZ domain-containing protein [Pedobacter sp. HMF7647]|uniref:PDZ domain-containing protein n=1 Tax=Hufsiella arboris TaxID=2695275 RepID=A0A7K1Y4M0_9SPHI|nr:S41 family peptidase [Hufsiella arboris]MXV49526.1 PDZ domain-containing protein [Hufsiella arboris]
MKLSKTLFPPLKKTILFACILVSITALAFRDDLFQASKNLEIFASVYKELNINYVDEINSSKMMRAGIDAMLDDLDPYTEYVPESDVEDYRMKYVSTQYGGVGATIMSRNGRIYISDPYQGFPAQKADIRAGDELVQINGITLKGKPNDEVSTLLKGPKSTPIKLLINRPGETKTIEKNIAREEITQPNVSYYGVVGGNVGYIKLDKFLENSAQEVKDALVNLRKNNINSLVLDLRYNGGGILQEAVKIVNLFVNKDILVVTQKGRNAEKTIPYRTFQAAAEPTLPLVVLVNNRSASASEIVAGSLQDLDRAVIIGQRSFGKGLVQQTFSLPYNSLVKVTVAKYYTPSGRCIQALDYTHRTTEGNVEKVADSLITEYKTADGRSVYDGSGIYPDLVIPAPKYSQITQTLVSKYYIFDYATKFRNANPSITEPKTFKLTDAQYAEFVSYLSDKDYNYSTQTEKMLTTLQKEAEKDRKMTEIKPEFDALKSKVFYSKKNDLTQFKGEIRQVLENEIVSRYYFQKGRLETGFKYDNDLKKAINVLSDKVMIASILKGEGTYKTIGKPGEDFSANAGK